MYGKKQNNILKIIFLGTNGWYDTPTGNTLCVAMCTNDYTLIFDCGSGIYKLDKYIDLDKPAFLFLSHFHLDHIIGFHSINKFNFTKGLTICGQQNIEKILNTIVCRPFTIPFNQLSYKTNFVELPENTGSLPFEIQALPLSHSEYTLGYRITIEGKIITFCTDTGYCENAVILAKNADLLITECTFKSGEENKLWPHLNPENAANIAKEAKVKNLALVHFESAKYITLDERIDAQKIAQGIFPATFAASDNIEFEII